MRSSNQSVKTIAPAPRHAINPAALPLESHQPLASQEPGPASPPQPRRCHIIVVRTTTESHRRGYAPRQRARNEAEVTGVAQPAGAVDTISPHP